MLWQMPVQEATRAAMDAASRQISATWERHAEAEHALLAIQERSLSQDHHS